ncbi:MAG: hypothetical protein ABIP68_03260 [Ferruginibacter sp.]
MSNIPTDPKGKKVDDPTNKKVYGNPIYNADQDITNQGKRIPMSDVKNDGSEPNIEKLYDNDLNSDEQEIKTNQQSLDDIN